MDNYFTVQTNFFGENTAAGLVERFGSPLYVYNEAILRKRCREMAGLISYPNFKANYSIKANSNLEILKIARQEGLMADAMSPGEIHVLLAAGFRPEEIFYISNNVSEEEMRFAIDRGICVSIDSLSQLKQYGRLNPGGKVAVRFNPGVGAGHHEKVVTAGKKTKFGINLDLVSEVKRILREYNLKLVGVNQHIGSLFMEGSAYVESVKSILSTAEQFESLEFVDLGGGFGIPYHKQEGQARLDLKELDQKLTPLITQWTQKYGKNVLIKIEPGRYIVAECGVLLGTVHAVKQNYGITYVGTDLGFNVLARPVMYDSHHDIEVYKKDPSKKANEFMEVTVVGNICESGDIVARGRLLPAVEEGDILGIMDAGAYGYSMSSNYNNRLRPAEVLVREDGSVAVIRRRDTLEDLMRNFV
ncbi:MAG: diaminopimelate decarboxylase [Clostridiales bacterium]|jgi:diaminopimelate decarboxylase|nr:diaminopimelate decarboxylase [Eubacteriales bacterium]MDH7565527.1 diaminopimelate decarboxylase [Clostridiales bacterium]